MIYGRGSNRNMTCRVSLLSRVCYADFACRLLFQRTDLEATNWLNDSLLDGVKVRKEVEGRSIMASVDSIVGECVPCIAS